jgi:transcription-repair coupling factor (superfamily II helicase)
MLEEAIIAREGEGFADDREPVRLDVNVDAYVPADYIPYEQAKIDVHRRIAAARDVAGLMALRDELDDRFGEPPEPLMNLISLQRARILLGEAGAKAVGLRQGRLTVTPLDLEPDAAARLREELPDGVYEPGRSQLTVRVPEEPGLQFPAVVAAAEALLKVVEEPAQAAA